MTKRININAGRAVNGGGTLGPLQPAGNPWTVGNGLADELVNRNIATYADEAQSTVSGQYIINAAGVPIGIVASPTNTSLAGAAVTPTISGAPGNAGTAGNVYSATFTATGVGTLTFSLGGGKLSGSGLSIDSRTGVLSGTPQIAGLITVAIKVTDSLLNTATTALFGITVASATGTSPPLLISGTPIVAGTSGSAYPGFTVSASGGVPPYSFSRNTAASIAGLSINSSSGVVSGTFGAIGTYAGILFSVTDSASVPVTVSLAPFTLTSNPTVYPLAMIVVSGYANLTKPYAMLPSVGGGSGARTFALTSGSLPAGLAMLSTTGEITGTPTATGTTALTMSVTDSSGTVSVSFSIVVGAAPVVLTASGDTTGINDSAAIESRMAAGTSVDLSSGGFIIKQPISVPGNCAVYLGAGATALFLAAGSNCDMFTNRNVGSRTRTDQNISIVGDGTTKLDGNGANQVAGSINKNRDGAFLVSAANVQLRGLITAPKFQNVCLIGCDRVQLRDHTFAATGTANTDGLDCGPGCTNICAENISGATGDDGFSLFAKAAQAGGNFSSGTPWETGASCDLFIFNNCKISLYPSNIIRLQADANNSMTRVYGTNLENTNAAGRRVIELGGAAYIDLPPTNPNQIAGVYIDGVRGFEALLFGDVQSSNINFKNVDASLPIVKAIDSNGVIQNLTIDGVTNSYPGATAHGTLFSTQFARAYSGITIKNVVLPTLTKIIDTVGGGTNMTLSSIKLGSGSNLMSATATWTGSMSEVGVLTAAVSPGATGLTAGTVTVPSDDAATASYKAARGTPLSAGRAYWLNQFIAGLRSDGLLAFLDRMYVFADEQNANDGLINILNPAGTKATTPAGATFTVDRGPLLDGTSQYVSLGTTWGAEGKFVLNSASAGVWCNGGNSGTGGKPHMGSDVDEQTRIFARNDGAETYRVNGAAQTSGRTGTTRLRHRAATRTSSTLTKTFYNGALSRTDSVTASSSISTGVVRVGSSLALFSGDQFSAAWTGAGLTDAQMLQVQTRLSTYLGAFGAT